MLTIGMLVTSGNFDSKSILNFRIRTTVPKSIVLDI